MSPPPPPTPVLMELFVDIVYASPLSMGFVSSIMHCSVIIITVWNGGQEWRYLVHCDYLLIYYE